MQEIMHVFQNKKRKLNNESFGEEISSYYFGLTRLIEPKVNFDEDKVKKCMEIAEDHLTEAFYVRLFQNEEDENKDLGKIANIIIKTSKICFRTSKSDSIVTLDRACYVGSQVRSK